jgi:hypothetical protein
MDAPCPFTHQPVCPIPPKEEDCVYNTDGYPYPYFPKNDPYHDMFTSIKDKSGVTSIEAPPVPTAIPDYFCPLMLVLW